MATANFYFKGVKFDNPKAKDRKVLNPNDLLPIFLHFHFNYVENETGKKIYKRMYYYIGEKIKPKFWNFEKQRVKETRAFPRYSSINSKLNDIENDILKIHSRCIFDKVTPTPELLKEKLLLQYKKLLKPTKEPHQKTFIEFINMFIKESETSKKKSTISVYKTTLKHIENYISYKKLNTINFEHINLDFYNSFTEYLSNDLQLSNNAVGKYIKTIKTFLNDATERNYNKNLAYRSKKFKTFNKPTDQIYLTNEELTAIYNLDLSNNKRLDKVRDLFIIGCYTALRFSDFSRIQKENIIEEGTILKIRTKKTDEVVYIPIHPIVSEILTKYDTSIPRAISNQKMNEYIKEVGKLAGIDTIVLKKVKKEKLTIDKKVKKYNLITTHTARRSGATNMYKSGIDSLKIMQITGHKTEKAFLRYIRITKEENAKSLLNTNFFKRSIKKA